MLKQISRATPEAKRYFATDGPDGACESSWEIVANTASSLAKRELRPGERRCAEVWRVPPQPVKSRRKIYRLEALYGTTTLAWFEYELSLPLEFTAVVA